jgi:RNA polymerase sigma-70 factor (ECF subfamily)
MTSRPAQPFAAEHSAQVAPGPPAPSAALPFPASIAAAVERCWCKAAAPAEWNLTREQFQVALERSATRRFSGLAADAKKIEAHLESLHAHDLALACACSLGSPVAWDFFVTQFRPELYRAARAIAGCVAGQDGNARELADSLYADLYGMSESEGRRKSLFDYFHGRSKLGTWLRAVLAQRHVDEIRRARRTEPLENEAGEENMQIAAPRATDSQHDPERTDNLAILQAALMTALGSLVPRDRLRLAYYYADDRTLAEIGRLLGEHEATVSRKLERTRRDVHARVEASLRKRNGMSEARVRLCLECAKGEWPFDLTAHLRPARPDADECAPADAGSKEAARKI